MRSLKGLASQACGPALGEADMVPPLAVALYPSLSLELTETQVDAATVNAVQWGARLVHATTLLHFPEMEVELDPLGSGYNADLASDEMIILWTRTHRASKSLSSRVPLSTACNPPDGAGEE
jgi:hypothetical protein